MLNLIRRAFGAVGFFGMIYLFCVLVNLTRRDPWLEGLMMFCFMIAVGFVIAIFAGFCWLLFGE